MFAILAGIVGVIAVGIWAQRRYRAVQYLMLLRAPVTHALVLLLLPLVYRTEAFRTLLVMEWPGILITTPLLVFSGMTAVHTAQDLFIAAPVRFRLRWDRPGQPPPKHWDDAPRPNAPVLGPFAGAYAAPLLVASPLLVAIVMLSPDGASKAAPAMLGGVLIAWSARAGARRLGHWLRAWILSPQPSVPATQVLKPNHRLSVLVDRWGRSPVGRALSRSGRGRPASDRMEESSADPSLADRGTVVWNVIGFIAAGVVVYALGGLVLDPELDHRLAAYTPALAYVALMTVVFGLVASAGTFVLDYYRIPLFTVMIAVLVLSYATTKREHYFRFAPLAPQASAPVGVAEAAAAWRAAAACVPDPAMVVVAVSGGGAQAAQWTADVLTRLRTDAELGSPFFHSIAMMSLVSGGALGASYVVDRYDGGTVPLDAVSCGGATDAECVSAVAGRSHAGALAWGLAYPDTLRTLFPSLMTNRDRAWALEQSWARSFRSGTGVPTLAAWADAARRGAKPAVIFNATTMETGQRFLISRMRVPDSTAAQFVDWYPDQDLTIPTAIRLSASFPYLSPISRPANPYAKGERREALERVAYHLTDGGYYDNFGVITAVEWIDAALKANPRLADRILLLEIRTTLPPASSPWPHLSWADSVLGPTVALANSAKAAQVDRAAAEVAALRQRGAEAGVRIDSETFWLRQTGTLPWHLAGAERASIREALASEETAATVARVRSFFRQGSAAPDCLDQPAATVRDTIR